MSFGIITILSARCEAPGDVGGICPIIAIIGAISHEGRTQASYKHLPSETNILGQKVIKEGCILRHDKINIRVNKWIFENEVVWDNIVHCCLLGKGS